MNRVLIVLLSLFFTPVLMAQHTIRMEIGSLPPYHASGSTIYLAGSFNGWNPQDEQYAFKKDTAGHYSIDLVLAPGNYEYKLTRGGWDKSECKAGGASSQNRILKVPGDPLVTLTVEDWADRFPALPRRSTASSNVCVIDTAFLIPQLKRTRRVWIYLPPSYCTTPGRKYPVLYMHDGQNIFDDATSYSGEWGVDEFLDTTALQQCIVVAIDHGGGKRLNEYNPYDSDRFGKGEGDLYTQFLVKTLKPYIDRHYRTLRDKKNTFIAGSSMGGLISLYAVLKYPNVFGGAGVFSPAFWITGHRILDEVRSRGKAVNARIYFYAGKQEGETMVPDMLKVFDEMHTLSPSEMISVIRDEGRHNEASWKKEFPLFYEWIMK